MLFFFLCILIHIKAGKFCIDFSFFQMSLDEINIRHTAGNLEKRRDIQRRKQQEIVVMYMK